MLSPWIDDKATDEESLYSLPIDEKSQEILRLREEQATLLQQKVTHFQKLYSLRRNVAIFIFVIIFVWLLCVMILVFLGSYEVTYLKGECVSYEHYSILQKVIAVSEKCSLLKNGNYLNLSESIVIALITTTTANVLGLSYIVAKWLFPKHSNDNSDIVPTK